MIRISVLYPYTEGARFDHDYYRDQHLPLLKQRMGGALLRYSVDRGLASGIPGEPAPFIAVSHLVCATIEDFQVGFGPHAGEIASDIPAFTDVAPVIQISEIVQE